ncbi:6099_t:CDS:2 [Funneliformis mosseae]|uniref:6099_t:CDS:1 n=1 Tax=Funneliformis mosseae TaxID=27381 RepID=A0A9N8VDV2_FUNMO|nr:6099_t:CDS:2 [Funneliformis mosseae]
MTKIRPTEYIFRTLDSCTNHAINLDLKEEANKLQIYLIKNPKEEEKLLLALKSTYKTKEDKRSLMKYFLNTITDEHQARTKIKITDEIPNGMLTIYTTDTVTLLYWFRMDLSTSKKRYMKSCDMSSKNIIKIFFRKISDKTYIPIYLFLSGAGTGKSRNAEEFHRTAIACLSEDEDLNLRKKIEDAFVFSVGFENGNSLRCDVEQSAYRYIGTRMLKQLLPDQDLDLIISNYEAPLTWEVFELVSKYENRELKEMTILLIIDGLLNIMKSNNDWNDKTSEFFKTLTNIHDLALRGTFVIPLCTATVTDPVESVLKITHSKRVYLSIASLDPPTIIKSGVVTSIFQTDDHIIKMLVNDCGGHGPSKAIARATLTRHLLEFNKHVPGTKKYPDHIVQPGLIRYVRESNSNGKDPYLETGPSATMVTTVLTKNPTCPPGSQFWQHFEHFVASFRTLKSRNLNDGELTSISSIHIGARLNGDFEFKNHHLELECAVHQEDTNPSNYGKGIKKIICEDKTVDVRECKYCIINGASAPYGDALLGLDVNLKSLASSKDFFILNITTNCLDFKLPKNSGIVDASNWDKYFGPYSGRAYAYANVGPLNINKASRRDLLSVYGIGET